jgi:hypothetical protein
LDFFGRLFVGVRLSEFSLGLLGVIFCLRGGDRGSALLSSRVEFYCLALLGLRNYLFGFLSFLFLCQRRQGQFVAGVLVGLFFVLFGFCLFEKNW